MNFDQLKDNWQRFGLEDPLWAIATEPSAKNNQWELDRFFQIGHDTIAGSMQKVLEARPDLARGRALDFGCGAGRLTRGLAAFFEEVVGVDVAASMIAKARELSPPDSRCHYVLNEQPDLRIFETESFDFILTFIVLQHMNQDYQAQYLGEFLRLLRPEGLCLFQLPDYLSNTATPGPDGAPVMEMYGMTPESVAGIIARHGGFILRTEENNWAGSYVRSFTYLVAKGG